MDVVTLSRIQFAVNSCFHYLYPPMSIGLGLMLVIMGGLYLKTKEIKYREMTNFWIRIFALTFALGVATGLVQVFAFGTNWARYSRFVGDVFGSALACEGIFAFFLESGFLGILLFGANRVGPKLHYFSSICVCLGAHFSAIWIIVANSWMQTPAGYRIEETPLGPRAITTDFWAMVFNPSTMDRLLHTILGCWLTGAFFVISVGAYYLLKQRHLPIARTMTRLGLWFAFAFLIMQFFSGDSSARLIAKYQPAKLAAFEGIYKTGDGPTPISVLGWVNNKTQEVHSLKIPAALSLLTYHSLEPVTGLDQIPKNEWPNVAAVFQTYHIMVLMWLLMMIVTVCGLWYWKKGRLEKKPWLLWSMIISVGFPHIAQQCGWISAEMGRQPWIVWKMLRTVDGTSQSISAPQVAGSIVMFITMYVLLFVLFIFLLDRKIKHGPEKEDEVDLVYRNILTQGRRIAGKK
ncbi:MAG TPA: cytochrome ubiquinol oxidase subunit I [Chlamydiales bacterium]|nr:cytochrome ubiquinol oxidase subunit I [Chlamydiales bacterium]